MPRATDHATLSQSAGIVAKSVRDPTTKADGERILVDRLWPRGVSKEGAALTEWMRDLAPSTELRQWFGHDPARWDEFRRRYRRELERGSAVALVQFATGRQR